jgi:hypothetical protein
VRRSASDILQQISGPNFGEPKFLATGFSAIRMAQVTFSDVPLGVMEKIVCHLKGQDKASVRLVSKAARDACDNTTTFLTVRRSQWNGFPNLQRLMNCTVVLFLDDMATLPSFRLDKYEQQTEGSFLLVCGEWWWKRADLRKWIGIQKESRISKVGLMLCITEQPRGNVDVCDMIEEVLDEGAPDLHYLGVWSQLVGFLALGRRVDARTP